MTDTANSVIEITNVPDFWNRVCNAEQRFLGLDYDGTLAPFEIDPMQARPLPGIPALLRSLAARGDTRLAIVSGRPVAEVMALLPNLPVTFAGSHGYELWPADGTCVVRQPTPEQRQGLDAAESIAQRRGYGHKLEHKVASLALHTRGLESKLAAAMEQELVTEWGRVASRYGLECRRFNGGVEIRCSGWNKGDVIAEMLHLQPKDVFAVYVGDDETDEDAFRVVGERGIAIKVGTPSNSTAAQGFLPDCRAVERFLRAWVGLTSTSGKRE
jgi:trehalose-phosphatase